MPTIEWNKGWSENLKQFQNGHFQDKLDHLGGKYYGDHWGNPENNVALKKVLNDFLTPYIDHDMVALEIGSGGGRFTQYMLDASRLYCVDLNEDMLDYIRERFHENDNIEYIVTHSTDLPGVEKHSVDFVFTYDVWVHLDLKDISKYLDSIISILKPGGKISIHFSNKRKPMAAANKGLSHNYPESMVVLLQRKGFEVLYVDDHTISHSTLIHAELKK